MRNLLTFLLCLMAAVGLHAQTICTEPTMAPQGGTYDDAVTISCTFPVGCTGGKYWTDGGEMRAKTYTGPFVIDYPCRVSVAGTNAEGRIITDIVSYDYDIRRVTPPYYTAEPREGIRKESFYVTAITWHNVTRTDLCLDEFATGKSRQNESAAWLTDERGTTINTSNSLWVDGLNRYKVYFNKNYDITTPGHYTLHIARGVFSLDDKLYNEEVVLNYEVAGESKVPVFTPESGEYTAPLTVTIDYPTDGSAYYKFYKIDDGKRKQYTGPITLTESATIEAFGAGEDMMMGASASATYILKEPEAPHQVLDTPTITLDGNTISISGPAGANIIYWMNDRMNTATRYTVPFDVTANGRISCVAVTSDNYSRTVDYDITTIPAAYSERGDTLLLTPSTLETMHLHGLSPNGRWAAGYYGSDTSSRAFVWDLASDKFTTISTVFASQLYGIANDGTAYGWRARTANIEEDTTDDDLLWGTCKAGVWTEQPKGFKANGITADGILYGNSNNQPATFDPRTSSLTLFTLGGATTKGTLNAATSTADAILFAGAATNGGKTVPAIWRSNEDATLYDTMAAAITAISPDGRWAIAGQDYRLNVAEGTAEHIISMSARSHNTHNPEVLRTITDDGTIFGTYDESLLSDERGVALVYTTDNRWRTLSDWLRDERSYTASRYNLTSLRAVSADGHTLLLHGIQSGADASDAFTKGLAVMTDVPLHHLAPTSVEASTMQSMETIKIAWEAPLSDATLVASYLVKRDGVTIANPDAHTFTYYDKSITPNVTYSYTIAAVYADGVTSEESYASEAIYTVNSHPTVRNIGLRPSGLDDMQITWDAPIINLPKLQYFDEQSEWYAFGTGSYDAEFGIRIPATDLANCNGEKVRTFQFLPTGPQKAYTLNLYRGNANGQGYEHTPFYSQPISPNDLNYGTVNVISLTTPQDLPATDLYVGLFIESANNDNMLGISYEGFRAGYTDLCRIDGIFSEMRAISSESQQATEIVLPLGIGVSSEEAYEKSLVRQYNISCDGQKVAGTTATRLKIENLAEGHHTFGITTTYNDSEDSDEATAAYDLKHNTEAYRTISNPAITVNADNTADFSWQGPMEDDRTEIHWGDLEAKDGWIVPEGFNTFTAAAIYPATLTAPYTGEYEITDLFFYPLTEAYFAVTLGNNIGDVYAQFVPATPAEGQSPMPTVVPDEINYLPLPSPLTLDAGINYQLSVNVYGAEPGTSPLAYDSSNKWENGFSNLIDYGYGLSDLNQLVQAGERPNWLMGFVIREKDAKPMPVEGYNVRIDGSKANTKLLTTPSFHSTALSDGKHTVAIDVDYTGGISKQGFKTTFSVPAESDGINDVSAEATDAPVYDLQGRRVITNHEGRQLFIIAGKKQLKH